MKLLALARSVDVAAKNQWLHLVVIFLFGILILVAFFISVLGYVADWYWTGVPEKTFWNWLEVLVAPVLLSGGGFLLYTAWTWSDHRLAEKGAHEAARHAALHGIANGYIDDIEQLLLKVEKGNSREGEIAPTIAWARTLIVLEGLDRSRKGQIIRFLQHARLLKQAASSHHEPRQQLFISLKSANLRGVHLPQVDLSGANLQEANLQEANLQEANLLEADLSGADLSGAIVAEKHLTKAKLEGATMTNGQKFEDWLQEHGPRGG
jgi:hypothetical protein